MWRGITSKIHMCVHFLVSNTNPLLKLLDLTIFFVWSTVFHLTYPWLAGISAWLFLPVEVAKQQFARVHRHTRLGAW